MDNKSKLLEQKARQDALQNRILESIPEQKVAIPQKTGFMQKIKNTISPAKSTVPLKNNDINKQNQDVSLADKHSQDLKDLVTRSVSDVLPQLVSDATTNAVSYAIRDLDRQYQSAENKKKLLEQRHRQFGKKELEDGSKEAIIEELIGYGLLKDTKEAKDMASRQMYKNPEAYKDLLERERTKRKKSDIAERQLETINAKSPKTIEERAREDWESIQNNSFEKEMAISPSDAMDKYVFAS